MGEDRKGGEEEEKMKKRVESLGWLTESSVMPKKRRSIEGVGAASIVELKAQLYRSQEEARKAKEAAPAEFLRAKKKPLPSDLFSHKNAGVENRANKDKLEMKAMKDGSAVYAALEKKAEIYEKLARGELPDEEDKDRYCVDFFQKTLGQDNSQPPEEHSTAADLPQGKEDAETDETLLFARPFGLGRASSTVDGDVHKRFVREVHEEASQARQKATMLKLRRQEQEAARHEKLKQAYLRKRLEQLTSGKQMASSENCSQTVNGWQCQKEHKKFDDSKPHSLLEELKSNKAHRYELPDIVGRVVEFSADQHGSRFIQQKLETCSVDEKASVFNEVLPHSPSLMTDVFGNYVIQKFFEHGSPEQRKELANKLVGNVLTLSLQMYGCRVIQKDACKLGSTNFIS